MNILLWITKNNGKNNEMRQLTTYLDINIGTFCVCFPFISFLLVFFTFVRLFEVLNI